MHQIIGAFQTISPDTKSPLESFSGIIDSTFTCIECKTERSQLENFLFLSLTIGNGKSLQDLCDIFLSEERLADVHCENCAKNCGHLLQRKIQRLSSTLIIHLKLFDNNCKKCRFKANVGDQIKIQSAEKVYHGELCALAGHIGPSISRVEGLNPQPSTHNPRPSTLHLNPQPSPTLNPQTLNPQPSTLNP